MDLKSLLNERGALGDQLRFLAKRQSEVTLSIRKATPQLTALLERVIRRHELTDWRLINCSGEMTVVFRLKDKDEELFEEIPLPLALAQNDDCAQALSYWKGLKGNEHLLNFAFFLDCLHREEHVTPAEHRHV